MDTQYVSFIAGSISTLIFVSSHFPMLLKAYKTKDLHSYSYLNLVLLNLGNLIYWFYIASLPLGPIWLLHTFYTISSLVLLILYRWPGRQPRSQTPKKKTPQRQARNCRSQAVTLQHNKSEAKWVLSS